MFVKRRICFSSENWHIRYSHQSTGSLCEIPPPPHLTFSSSETKQGLLVAQQHLHRIWEPGHRLLVNAVLMRQVDEMFSGHHLCCEKKKKNGLLYRPCRAETVEHQQHLALFPHKLFQDGSKASQILQRVNCSKILQIHRKKKWSWAHRPAVYYNHKRCV